MSAHLLSDEQVQQFLGDGFYVLRVGLSDDFHASVCRQLDEILESEANPGNNLLPRIPELSLVYEDDVVAGALQSVLGPDYEMEDHRFPHVNRPQTDPQKIHKDGAFRGEHRMRRAFGFYYPQTTPETLGPTGVLPGSHYFNEQPDTPVLPLVAEAGVVVIAHYEIWHRATANQQDRRRYMMKFQFTRQLEPESPSWDFESENWDTDSRMLRAIWDWHLGPERHVPAQAGDIDRKVALNALSDPSEAVRMEAAYGLAALTRDAGPESIVDDLAGLIRESSEPSAQSAVYGLAAIGEPAVDQLIDLLGEDGDVRHCALHALGEMGKAAASAESALRDVLDDSDPAHRRRAAEALGNCEGSEPDVTMDALLKQIDDGDKRAPRAAAAAAARVAIRLGASASDETVQTLKAALSHDNRYIRGLAARALERIGTPEAIGIALDWLHTSRWCPLTTAESPF